MKSLLIRNIQEETMAGLKRRAQRHHRSLQKEVESLLLDAARMTAPEEHSKKSMMDGLRTVATRRHDSTWSRESIYGEDGR